MSTIETPDTPQRGMIVGWTEEGASMIGAVVQVVPAGQVPFPGDYPMLSGRQIRAVARDHESYVVLAYPLYYWPDARQLRILALNIDWYGKRDKRGGEVDG